MTHVKCGLCCRGTLRQFGMGERQARARLGMPRIGNAMPVYGTPHGMAHSLGQPCGSVQGYGRLGHLVKVRLDYVNVHRSRALGLGPRTITCKAVRTRHR